MAIGDRFDLRRFVALATLGAVVLAAAPAEAGGFHISIIGGRRNAMLAMLAAPDDLTALFHNPAGLADQGGVRLHLFGSMSFVENEFELMALDAERFPEINPRGCGEAGRDPCPWPIVGDGYYEQPISPESSFGVLPFLGVSTDLSFVSPRLRDVVLAVGAYAPNLYGGSLPEEAPTRYFMTDGYFAVIAATVGLGWRISDRVALGAHVSYNYMRMKYGFRLSLIDVLTPEGAPPDLLGQLAQTIFGDVDLRYVGVDHGAGFCLGLLLDPTDWMSIGITYMASSSANFEGDLALSSTREGSDLAALETLGYALPTGLEVQMAIPPALGLGFNFTPAPWAEIGLDLRVWLYNMYTHQTLRPIYDPDQPGEQPMSEASLSRDKDNTVSFELALGALFRPWRGHPGLELMVGVGYDHSPVSDESFSLDSPSMSQVIASAGLRWRINDHFRLAAAYMMLKYLARDVTTSRTSPPTNVRGSGFNHIPSLELEVAF
jgi:long-subunit fatty acid transport protein